MRGQGLLVTDDLPEWHHNQQQPSRHGGAGGYCNRNSPMRRRHGPRKPAGVGLTEAGWRGKDLPKAPARSLGANLKTPPPEQIASLDTPAVLVDLDIVWHNIAQFQSHANKIGMAVRPRIKTHKLPQIALMQLAAGAVGITCQKISEAEAMLEADSRLNDVLMADTPPSRSKRKSPASSAVCATTPRPTSSITSSTASRGWSKTRGARRQ